MFNRLALPLVCAMLVASCDAADTPNPVSDTAAPLVDFTQIERPDVPTDWPCPPFTTFETVREKTGDSDGDNILDCQEEFLGSDPASTDSDNDTVSDLLERGDLTADMDRRGAESGDPPDGIIDPGQGLDTDGDGILDIVDTDDDGDGIPTAEEDLDGGVGFGNGNGDPLDDDFDGDGERNSLDPDDDGDFAIGSVEDVDGDGDPRNDDSDGDGIFNYADPDDDNDTAAGCEDEGDRLIDGSTINSSTTDLRDDADLDGVLNIFDEDDDGDGILTKDEDWTVPGDPCLSDIDRDRIPDFRDLDDDGDSIDSLMENRNGLGVLNNDSDNDGTPDFRDDDDDGDGVLTLREEPDGASEDAQDTDRDGTPDYLSTDDDGDGILTVDELPTAIDIDVDGIPDYLDADDDNDGCPTRLETAEGQKDENITPANCAWFDLTVNGTNFGDYTGERVYFALLDDQGQVVGVATALVGVANDFSISFPVALEANQSYSLDFYVDVNGDKSCAFGDDFPLRATGIQATSQAVVVDTTPSDANSAACQSF